MSVILPKHSDLTIFHNYHKANGFTVKEFFETQIELDESQWESGLAFQKAVETNELWSIHWTNDTEDQTKLDKLHVHSLYAPTFKDLMKTMLLLGEGKLEDYE